MYVWIAIYEKGNRWRSRQSYIKTEVLTNKGYAEVIACAHTLVQSQLLHTVKIIYFRVILNTR